MLRESEIKNLISHEVPALAIELSYIKDANDVYKVLDCLTCYTRALIHEDKLNEVEERFTAAHQLLREGNKLIQLAVENIFIFSISSLLEVSITAAQPVRKLFLKNFSKEYCKQINSRYP